MFENIRNAFTANSAHLEALIDGMQDAESRYLNNQYTLRAFVEILEGRIRIGSDPTTNQRKLANKYVKHFCYRNGINSVGFLIQIQIQIQIQDMIDPAVPNFNGDVYYSK